MRANDPMRVKGLIGVTLALGAALFVSGCNYFGGGGTAAAAEGDASTLKGKPAGDFSLKTLGGKELELSSEKGKVVVIDTWATWCPPCRESLPHIQKLATDDALTGKGLVVWAIDDQESNDDVARFLKENKYTFTVLMDPQGAVLQKYLVTGIPTTFIVGRNGVIQDVFEGYGKDSAKLIDAAVDKALAQPTPD